jgi:hypothetical protein
MRIFKYLIGIWTAIVLYAVFSFLSGPKGLSAYNHLLYEREQQVENLNNLGYINEELGKIKNNILFDRDTQLVHARLLGYAHENERFIRIVGLGNTKNIPAVMGKLYIVSDPEYIPDKNLKIISLSIGFLIFAFLFVMELIETRIR